jgi:TetR/AcrR family transcriptional regulator, regulator of biofilm formation and stress response
MDSANDGRLARGAARRSLLMDAAVNVVASAGSGALTHRAVASEARVSVASVTYHFPSISQLRRDTFEHAGSGIGLELADLVLAASVRSDDVPDICASYAVHLVLERRVETAAVFELIIAAGHDDDLKPVVALYNGMLAELLTPYMGDATRAHTVGAAIQGLMLVQLASAFPLDPGRLGGAVSDLIRRYRADEPTRHGRNASGSDTTTER